MPTCSAITVAMVAAANPASARHCTPRPRWRRKPAYIMTEVPIIRAFASSIDSRAEIWSRAANSGMAAIAIALATDHSRMPLAPLCACDDSTSSITADMAIMSRNRLVVLSIGRRSGKDGRT